MNRIRFANVQSLCSGAIFMAVGLACLSAIYVGSGLFTLLNEDDNPHRGPKQRLLSARDGDALLKFRERDRKHPAHLLTTAFDRADYLHRHKSGGQAVWFLVNAHVAKYRQHLVVRTHLKLRKKGLSVKRRVEDLYYSK